MSRPRFDLEADRDAELDRHIHESRFRDALDDELEAAADLERSRRASVRPPEIDRPPRDRP